MDNKNRGEQTRKIEKEVLTSRKWISFLFKQTWNIAFNSTLKIQLVLLVKSFVSVSVKLALDPQQQQQQQHYFAFLFNFVYLGFSVNF